MTGAAAAWRPDLAVPGAVGELDGRAVYAVGDVHGCYALALALVSAVAADLATLPPDLRPLIVFLGDYVDRGPSSAEVLSMLVWMRRHAPCDVAFLRGNHEAMLLDFLADPVGAPGWLAHGGIATLASYGVVADPRSPAEDQGEALRDALLDRMPVSHHDLLRGLPVRLVVGDHVFVHAGLRPGVPLDQQEDRDCLWIRHDFLDAPGLFEKTVVHGHSWSGPAPVMTPARVSVDTGAYATGVLTAARLTPAGLAFVQAAMPAGASPA